MNWGAHSPSQSLSQTTRTIASCDLSLMQQSSLTAEAQSSVHTGDTYPIIVKGCNVEREGVLDGVRIWVSGEIQNKAISPSIPSPFGSSQRCSNTPVSSQVELWAIAPPKFKPT